MNIRQIIGKVFLAVIVFPISRLFWCGVFLRNLAYNLQIFRSEKLPVKVISIGNISMGGTGKTPMAITLLNLFNKYPIKVAYLSRGYGRATSGFLRVEPQIHSAFDVGDEALQVATLFPELVIAVCEDRVQGVKQLLREVHQLDLVILDDAFQHRKIHRDLDIVMVDANKLPWNDFLFPSGRLREPVRSLKRADIVVIHNAPNEEKESRKILKRFKKILPSEKIVMSVIDTECAIPFFSLYEPLTKEDLHKRTCMGISGIGNNNNFYNLIRSTGMQVADFFRYSDHHTYQPREIKKVVRRFNRMSQQPYFLKPPIILTTHKDYMRLKSYPWFCEEYTNYPFYYIRINLVFIRGEDNIQKILQSRFGLLFEHQ